MKRSRRFIADAVCPQCGERDTLYLESDADFHEQACTRCSFRQRLARGSSAVEIEAVRIIEPERDEDPSRRS